MVIEQVFVNRMSREPRSFAHSGQSGALTFAWPMNYRWNMLPTRSTPHCSSSGGVMPPQRIEIWDGSKVDIRT